MLLKKEKIKILGAGISGLTTAITLARNGFEVEVFEKRSRIGSFFKRDVHSLRNYFYDYDVIEKYKNLGIKISNAYPIFREFRFSPSLKQVEIYSKDKPLFYNFIRGYDGEKSFDVELYEIAKKLGVKFYFNKSIPNTKVDIVATGAQTVKGIGYGEHYSEVCGIDKNANHIFLDNNYSPNGYSCMLPFNDEVSIILGSTKEENKDELKKKFNHLKKNNPIIRKIIRNAKFKNKIFGFIYYDLPKTAIKNGKIYIGEAAGFLDAATVFGTHYAILSGYLAAKAILKDENYDKLWKAHFGNELKFQYIQRIKLQKFDNKKYEKNIEYIINKYGNKITADTYKKLKQELYAKN